MPIRNREEFNADIAQRKRNRKIKAIEYKGGKCEHCGGIFHPSVYDFHHIESGSKDGRMTVFLSRRWESLRREVDKCILLCSNCHRIEHYKRH